ncbi:MAG: YfiR/HmsC family protein [Acidobacteriaceae bacterium]
MNCERSIAGAFALIVTFIVMLFGIAPTAYCADHISADNLEAAMRTLSFLESLPKDGAIIVGVVYPSDVPAGKASAVQAAKIIDSTRGPGSRQFQAVVISTDELAGFDRHLDALFLVPGSSMHPDVILEAILHRRLVSISDDPICIEAKCCVLMVRAGQRVEITLNTALADKVGARFSLVFTMVVKRI